eukprot:g1010.t1
MVTEVYKYNMEGILCTLDQFISLRLETAISLGAQCYNNQLTPYIRIVDACNLEISEEKAVVYVTQVMSAIETNTRDQYKRSSTHEQFYSSHHALKPIVEIIMNSGDFEWSSKFTRNIFRSIFKLEIPLRG